MFDIQLMRGTGVEVIFMDTMEGIFFFFTIG